MDVRERLRAGASKAAWGATLLVLLAAPAAAEGRRGATLRDAEGYAMAACLTRQEAEPLRREGHLWAAGIFERGGDPDRLRPLGEAVAAEAARHRVPLARGDGPVDAPLIPMPVLHCHEVVRAPAVRAAIARAVRGPATGTR